MSRYEEAKKMYAAYGIDTDAALERLSKIPVSVHCWQGDDVIGFDGSDSLSGGIQTTGNYPGRARTPEELFEDAKRAFALMPGKKRINVHACYALLGADKGKVDRDAYTYKYFEPWVEWAKENGLDGVDFNPTFFAHPKMKDGLSLSSPDEETRQFWVRHGKASLKIAAEIGKAMNSPCLVNIWIPDGYKDIPADRLSPRLRLKKSLDEILEDYDKEWVIPAVESKVFGIGIESYTVGSNEFYQNYAAKNNICCLLDTGHYHPTEVVSDKIPALLAFYDKIALHVSRPVRWDSDHVLIVDDELKELSKEIIRNEADEKVLIGLDYFDASINRLCAWVTGVRSMQKALLNAMLQPYAELKQLQDENNFSKIMYLNEKFKFMPIGDVWDEYLRRQGLSEDWFGEVEKFEKEVFAERV
ncbi:MAG: L-rhamnose isomerase [Clostridiales bacterium]|nr:L-rhamnose isomerase [Clostridiales bacterium]